jgi:hypothetical protein
MWSEKISEMLWSEKFGDELLRWLTAKIVHLKWSIRNIKMVVLGWLY